jgi:hypothetical protein
MRVKEENLHGKSLGDLDRNHDGLITTVGFYANNKML